MPIKDRRSFPVKLHACLTELEREEQSHIASFQPHGRAMMVHKQDEFLAILPRWFNHSKKASFQRQLNLYDFQRITKGPDKHAYYHPLFQRGNATLAACIPRHGIKGAGPRHAIECCPDFSVAPNLLGSALGQAVTNQGVSANMIEPPNMMRPSMAQLILNRLAPQQSVVNPSAGLSPSLRVSQPSPLSVPAFMAHGTSMADRPVMEDSLTFAIDLHLQSRLQQQAHYLELYRQRQACDLQQRLYQQQVQHLLASADPPLPGATDVLFHAALRQQQRERDYQALSIHAAGTQVPVFAQFGDAAPLERYHALNPFVPPARLGRQGETGVDHDLLTLLRGQMNAMTHDPSGNGHHFPSRYGNLGQFGPP